MVKRLDIISKRSEVVFTGRKRLRGTLIPACTRIEAGGEGGGRGGRWDHCSLIPRPSLHAFFFARAGKAWARIIVQAVVVQVRLAASLLSL